MIEPRCLHRLGTAVPAVHRAAIGGIVASPRAIRTRIRQLGRELREVLADGDWLVVALLNGSVLFVADLIRELDVPLRLDFMGVSSYGHRTDPGELVYTKDLTLDVDGRRVLVVDDILDSGRTLQAVTAHLRRLGAREVRTCVLLDKPGRRAVPFEADHVGFRIPDWFVVGYGLDFAERFRNLPFIGVIRPEMVARMREEELR